MKELQMHPSLDAKPGVNEKKINLEYIKEKFESLRNPEKTIPRLKNIA